MRNVEEDKQLENISEFKCAHGTSVVEISNRRHIRARYFFIVKYE